MESGWETLYRWEWFHRAQWQSNLREVKRNSSLCFARIMADIGGGPALDCSCGFGLKTIVMKEAGVDIDGSDGCAYAVDKARDLATIENLGIDYFTSSWSELPSHAPRKYRGIFNDALSWSTTRREFESALAGFIEALEPGGVLVFMGAEQDSPSDVPSRRKLLEDTWQKQPRFRIDWTCENEGTRCTCIVAREKGDTFIDEHRIFLIEENGKQRIESATVRQPVSWSWAILKDLFTRAGFSRLETRAFTDVDRNGAVIKLNVATK